MAQFAYEIGKRYGNIEIIGHRHKPYFKNIVRCCLCGHEYMATTKSIDSAKYEEYGCRNCKRIKTTQERIATLEEKYVGKSFGNLKILSVRDGQHPYMAGNISMATCQCMLCGSVKEYILNRVTSGQIKSCECIEAACLQKGHEAIEQRRIAGTVVSSIANNKISKNNSSGYRGVSWVKKERKWRAYINIARKHISLGLYDNVEDAARARKAAEEEYYKPIIERWENEKNN